MSGRGCCVGDCSCFVCRSTTTGLCLVLPLLTSLHIEGVGAVASFHLFPCLLLPLLLSSLPLLSLASSSRLSPSFFLSSFRLFLPSFSFPPSPLAPSLRHSLRFSASPFPRRQSRLHFPRFPLVTPIPFSCHCSQSITPAPPASSCGVVSSAFSLVSGSTFSSLHARFCPTSTRLPPILCRPRRLLDNTRTQPASHLARHEDNGFSCGTLNENPAVTRSPNPSFRSNSPFPAAI